MSLSALYLQTMFRENISRFIWESWTGGREILGICFSLADSLAYMYNQEGGGGAYKRGGL